MCSESYQTYVWVETREDQVTEVLQASQSHWGLLLRYEAVSPFSYAMSNSNGTIDKIGDFVTSPIPHQRPKIIFFGTFKV